MHMRGKKLMVAVGALIVATYFIFTVCKEIIIPNYYYYYYDHESSSFQVPAIYNFGDSNSDTGANSAVFEPVLPPYGMTYFGKPAGRLSDGRLIIDFIADKLGLPYLSAYVDSVGTNFRHGANFAVSGATIQPADALMLNKNFNPVTLPVQLSQFQQFKRRASDLYLEAKSSEIKNRLPRPEDYSRAIYRFDIGQNDLHAGIKTMKEQDVKKYIPTMINDLSSTVKKLYNLGARTFWIHNTGPIGCLPFFVKNYPPAPGNADKIGCVESYNKLAQEFNKQLEDEVSKLAVQLQESSFVYFDVYSLKYLLISQAKKYGFKDPLGQCLWTDGDINKACDNPSEYISWDAIHYTEAANKWVVDHLQDGFINVTKIPLTEGPNLVGKFRVLRDQVKT